MSAICNVILVEKWVESKKLPTNPLLLSVLDETKVFLK